jgi:hypothetical protein
MTAVFCSLLARRPSIRYFDRQPPPDRGPRINEQIRISPVRPIGANGKQVGVVPTAQALERVGRLAGQQRRLRTLRHLPGASVSGNRTRLPHLALRASGQRSQPPPFRSGPTVARAPTNGGGPFPRQRISSVRPAPVIECPRYLMLPVFPRCHQVGKARSSMTATPGRRADLLVRK